MFLLLSRPLVYREQRFSLFLLSNRRSPFPSSLKLGYPFSPVRCCKMLSLNRWMFVYFFFSSSSFQVARTPALTAFVTFAVGAFCMCYFPLFFYGG